MYLVYNVNNKKDVEVLPAFLINDLFKNKKITVTKEKEWTFLKSKQIWIAVKPFEITPITNR